MNFLEYLPIFVFIIIAMSLSAGFALLSGFVGPNNPDKEKLSAYECGFPPFDDARGRFDVRFYLVAILFIIFDLEVAFLFPWAISLSLIGFVGYLDGEKSNGTNPSEAKIFAKDTKVDAMAISVGNVHLQKHKEGKLDLERIRLIEQVTSIPLVIHGGSGVPVKQRSFLSKNSISNPSGNSEYGNG